MAGLGLGGLLGGRLADRSTRRLLLFAGIEAGVGLCALAIPAALDCCCAPRSGRPVSGYSLVASNALRFVLSFAVLLVPTLLMGATLPLLRRFCTEAPGRLGRRVGMLYGLNTLGSALGCFAAGYWMLQTLGLSATNRLAAGVNLAVAAVLALAYFKPAPAARPRPAPAGGRRTASPPPTPLARNGPHALLAAGPGLRLRAGRARLRGRLGTLPRLLHQLRLRLHELAWHLPARPGGRQPALSCRARALAPAHPAAGRGRVGPRPGRVPLLLRGRARLRARQVCRPPLRLHDGAGDRAAAGPADGGRLPAAVRGLRAVRGETSAAA